MGTGHGISRRLLAASGVCFLAAGVLIVFLVNFQMRRQALVEAEEKARILLDRNMATHRYFSERLKPSVFDLAGGRPSPARFDPVWMSSTFALRIIEQRFKDFNSAGYSIRDSAFNARSPENEADVLEAAFIEELNRDPSLERRSTVQSDGKVRYLHVLRRGESLDESCMRCHGDPAEAPPGLVDRYGPLRSFHRRLGEAVSAISIRIPLEDAYQTANRLSVALSALLVGVLCLLFGVQSGLNHRLVFRPLQTIRDTAQRIAEDPLRLGDEIRVSAHGELQDMARSFNAMSIQLKAGRDHLEERIRERTAQLQRSEARYRSILEATPDPVMICASDSTIEFANEAMSRLLGGDPAGRTCHEALSGRDRPCEGCDTSVVHGGHAHAHQVFIASLGRRFHVVHTRMTHGDGRVSRLSVYRDMTEQHAIESRIRTAQKMQAIGTLAGGVAHHFNNLVGIIIGFSEVALDRLKSDGMERECLREILAASERAARIVDQLLQFSRQASAGDGALDPEAAMGKLRELLRASLPRAISLSILFGGGLPPIRATQEQFQQIVLNLVSNAADAMRPHGGVLTIELRRSADSPSSGGHRSSHLAGDCVRLRVADTGCGIPAEVLPRVFEPFFTTKPVDAGTGMGLAIVHGIVQELQGDIRIESEAGKGTVVEVCFPAVESATGDLRVQRPADSTYRENEDRLPDAGRAPGGRRNAES